MPNIVLQTEALTKQYGSLTAVNNLTIEVYEGEVFGFLGPNGAGKTTSINMMCGLLKPDAGRVLVRGVPMNNGAQDIRAQVGVCPQDIVLWERLTCLEQLQFIGQMYGLTAQTARQRSEQLLVELDLVEKRNKQARTLSGGMQRRLNLALALVHDPAIVVLDEPEAGLDPQSRVKVRDYIKSLAHKKTVILTTHNMDEADRVADRVAIIDHGQLLVLDTPQALKQRVGEGDVVEISLDTSLTDTQAGQLQATLSALIAGVTVETERKLLSVHADANGMQARLAAMVAEIKIEAQRSLLTVRALNAVSALPAVLEKLADLGLHPGEVRVRENTLEDVFIQLTGRRLRE